ncbi:MAG: molybdopterin biosynthesis protein MoeB [Lysobacterales bacterium]|jgi:molybdopterin/thiamine biosynthesis adenylyltransferase|nr:MAG: molybdopterin biosynthesis protein MoeB [Xanthomonadales bacterium]
MIAPQEASSLHAKGARLIDVRERHEYGQAHAAGAECVPLSDLARGLKPCLPMDEPILILCATGPRACRAAEWLAARGHRELYVVAGGTAAWVAAGLPVVQEPDQGASARYARQIVLPEVGIEGQQRLQRARVGLVGAGGLGSPVALYLAAAGVGMIRLADPDRVELSNLHRQILHGEDALGLAKTESAALRLQALAPELALETWPQVVDGRNVEAFIAGCDLVIDGSDRIATRYLLSDACFAAGVPLIHAAVEGFRGMITVFDPRRADSPCYRCLFPDEQAPEPRSCVERGVLGPVPGVFGCLQAVEALKLLLGAGETLIGRLLIADLLAPSFRILSLPRDPVCSCAHAAGRRADRSAPAEARA